MVKLFTFLFNFKQKIKFLILISVIVPYSITHAQLKVTGGASSATVQSYLFGPGVKISNISINCSGLNQFGTFNAQATQLGIDSGLLITTGTVQEAMGPDNQCCSSITVGTNSTDPCIASAVGAAQLQFDPCIIEFDIIPTCDTFNVSYVFGSEEYNTGIGGYNDVFGFFVTGPNPAGGTYSCQDFALIPGSTNIVSINNVNYNTNTAYYRDNHKNTSNLYNDFQYNGLTVPLVATIPVIPCTSYHMKVAVVDIGNPGYDSGVFLKFKSLACAQDQILSVTTKDSILCTGQNTTLIASGGSNYTWSPSTGLNSTTGNMVTVTPDSSITYTVNATEAGTCLSKDSIGVRVNPTPVANFSSDSLVGCYPLCINFTNLSNVSSGTIASMTWNFGDGDTSDNSKPTYCYKTPGAFTVSLKVTTNEGCDNSKIATSPINVYEPPHASFSINPVSASQLAPTITFTDQSTDVYGIQTWKWEFGDGTDTGAVSNLSHTYADTGTFCADLIVTNIHGCHDTTQRCAEISPLFALYVPNAFTPNHSGLNDVFMAKGEGMRSFDMWIFDRWGQQIFHSSDINTGWDGTVQNSHSSVKCEEDTYIWLIDANDSFNTTRSYMGKVTLLG